jgi:protein-disulfide isomerase
METLFTHDTFSSSEYMLGTYPVPIEFLCNHCANELTKFIKKTKKIIDVLLMILHVYIKFPDQNHRNKRVVKRQNF